VKQVINVSQIFAKKMIEEQIHGAIVNVSSQVRLRVHIAGSSQEP
jgi:short-subunit dehydrogenase